ncbi:hypothetical protein NECID01_1436 [Nematocida sp. AWRm77]|nr:hypothetical protein NECID01_1436 [Nematocida sp. AWRm77]
MKRILQLVSCCVCILIILYPCMVSTTYKNINVDNRTKKHQPVKNSAPTSINPNPNWERGASNTNKGQEERVCLEIPQENDQSTNQTQSKTSGCKIWMIIVLILIGLGLASRYGLNINIDLSDLSTNVSASDADTSITAQMKSFIYKGRFGSNKKDLEALKKCIDENKLSSTDFMMILIRQYFQTEVASLAMKPDLEIDSFLNDPKKIREDIKSMLTKYKSSIENSPDEKFNNFIAEYFSVLKCVLKKNKEVADFKILFEQYASSYTTLLDTELASMLQKEFDIKRPETGKNMLLNKNAELYLKKFLTNALNLLNKMLVVDSEGKITRVRTFNTDKTSMAIFDILKNMLLFIKELKKNLTPKKL